MAVLNTQALVDKLNKLNNSQQSIETVSAWCIFYRKDARKVIATWEDHFARAPNMQKKLAMLYLANDILQNSRKRGPEFVNEFYRALPRALQHMLKHGDDKVQKAVQRLIAIWGERMVFGHSGSKPFNDLIAGAETPRKGTPRGAATNGSGNAGGEANGQPAAAALAPLAQVLGQLETLAPQLAGMEQSCSPSLAGDLLHSGNMQELEAGRQLLAQYAAALEAEAAQRGHAIALLSSLLAQQEHDKQAGQARMQQCQEVLMQLDAHISATARSPPPPEIDDEEVYSPSAAGAMHDAWDPEPNHSPSSPAYSPTPSPKPAAAAQPAGAAAPPQPQESAALPPELAQYAAAAVAGGNAVSAGGTAGGNAAALAAQLAATGGAAKLLQALAALPKEQQNEIGRGMAALAQPGGAGGRDPRANPSPMQPQQAEPDQAADGEEEYDPEEGGMVF